MERPATLWVFLWRRRPVFLRLAADGGGRREMMPTCPRLFDEAVSLPVVPAGARPERPGMLRFPMVADWLSDLLDEDWCRDDKMVYGRER